MSQIIEFAGNHLMLFGAFVVVTALIIKMELESRFSGVGQLNPTEAVRLMNNDGVVVLDVREPNEQSISRLPGAITADLFLENTEKYNDYIKIGYCTISYRSGIFAHELHQKGIPIYNLRGGLLAWVHAGGKVYNGGGETKRIHVYSQEWNLGPENFEVVW